MVSGQRNLVHCFVVSSSFPCFFLDTIEEAYNMNTPLIFYPNKSGFRSLFSLFYFFWLGLVEILALTEGTVSPIINPAPKLRKGHLRKVLNIWRLPKTRQISTINRECILWVEEGYQREPVDGKQGKGASSPMTMNSSNLFYGRSLL